MKLQLQAFAHRSLFFRAHRGLGKIKRNTQNNRPYFMLNHRSNEVCPWQFSGTYCHRESVIF